MPHDFQPPQRTSATRVTSSTIDDRLPCRPTPKFIYAAHPNAWEWHPDHGFIPRAKKIPLVPGVNGCRKGANGAQAVLTRLRSDGWIVLDEDGPIIRTGDDGDLVKDQGYLYRWEGRSGPVYQDAWAAPSIVGYGRNASVDWVSQYDREGFAAWRAQLVRNGTIPKPSAAVLARLLKVQARRAGRRVHESHDGNPHVQAEVKAQQDRLEAMQDAAADKHGAKVRGRPKKAQKATQKPRKANV